MIIPAQIRAARAFLDWSQEVRLQTITVSLALPRTLWRVCIEDADEVMKSTPLSADSQVHTRAAVEVASAQAAERNRFSNA
jgi:hypothetical protein